MELIGWLSSFFLIICGMPLARQSYKAKRTDINAYFLGMWFAGEVLGLLYVLSKGDIILISNYLINGCSCGIVLYYKLFPGGRDEKTV